MDNYYYFRLWVILAEMSRSRLVKNGGKFNLSMSNEDSDEEEGDGTEILIQSRKEKIGNNNISFLFMRFWDIQTIQNCKVLSWFIDYSNHE